MLYSCLKCAKISNRFGNNERKKETTVDSKSEASQYPVSSLAYLGDCVFELCVREYLVRNNEAHPSVKSLEYVTAHVQSGAVEKLLPLLDDEETSIYKRGRNTGHTSVPKSSSAGEYRRATGLESLFGWLYLQGRKDRIDELFSRAFVQTEEDTSEQEFV